MGVVMVYTRVFLPDVPGIPTEQCVRSKSEKVSYKVNGFAILGGLTGLFILLWAHWVCFNKFACFQGEADDLAQHQQFGGAQVGGQQFGGQQFSGQEFSGQQFGGPEAFPINSGYGSGALYDRDETGQHDEIF